MHPVYRHDGGFAGVLKYAFSDSCLDIIVRFLYIKGDGGIENDICMRRSLYHAEIMDGDARVYLVNAHLRFGFAASTSSLPTVIGSI